MPDTNFVHHQDSIERAVERFAGAGLRCSTAIGDRIQRGRDDTYLAAEPPDAVVFAASTADVVAIVKICNELSVPMIAFGAGTSAEGHIMARKGGVCIDLSQMNEIVSVSADDFHCTVQPGVIRGVLNEYLRDTGLFFPVDACTEASIGGMAATRASGTNAVRYGTMRENVVSMQVVLADGRIIRTGSLARKSAAGYDLTRLFVGGGGTLGIVTELTVRLYGIPEHVLAATCSFPSVQSAANAVREITQVGIPIGKVEIIDEAAVKMINAYSGTSFEPMTQLFFEFSGTVGAIEEYARTVEDTCATHNGRHFSRAGSLAERNRMWDARHKVWYAALAARPGCKGWSTDISVPVSRIAEAITLTHEDLEKLPFPAPIVGHVGDGNFHVLFLIDLNAPDEIALMKAANARMVERAIEMNGTCTGEHGIGYVKNEWLVREFGKEAVELMRQIKGLLDPKGLLNPGKLFDA